MSDFSITIVRVGKGVAGFQPDLPDVQPGDPLNVPPSSRIPTQISHPFHIHIDPFQVAEVFVPNSMLPDGKTPMYVVSTDNNTPIMSGQCRVNPDNPATWKPCVAAPGHVQGLVARLPDPIGRLREEERRHLNRNY
jgi:hypothetical protein